MKKIIALVSFSICIAFAHAQDVTVKDVLTKGFIPMDGFIKYIVPHIPKVTAAATNPSKVMKPRTYRLSDTMNIKQIVAAYDAPNPIELQDIPTIIANYQKGNFDSIPLVKGILNAAVVVYRAPGQRDEEYIVDLFFSPSQQKWAINARPMDLEFKFGKGTNYITY